MNPADEDLAARIRALLKNRKGYSEQKMFGGVCFMINGHMCVAPWEGWLVVRLDKADHDQTQSEPYVGLMDLTGKVMRGWAKIAPEGIADEAELKDWVNRAIRFVRTLPAKK